MTEHIKQINLPELAKFSETPVKPGDALDLVLATVGNHVHCFTLPEEATVADSYRTVVGKTDRDFSIELVDDPIQAALQPQRPGVIPLVLHSATDRVLNERMFRDGPEFGQLLMGHIYISKSDHESPSLHAIGVAKQGLDIVNKTGFQTDAAIIRQMDARRNKLLGNTLSGNDFRKILQSKDVHKIIAHALGPVGTNISQAMAQYIEALGVGNKTELLVHGQGVEPIAYAEQAAQQVEEGVIPIHMECAVYYEMGELFDQRTGEVVFADHHYMPLDAMRLGSIKEMEELASSGIITIATHPSPRPLVKPWIDTGRAKWIKATSNTAAAQMVIDGEAQACVTTASSLNGREQMITRHLFGSPIMLFTIGTPLTQQQLRTYL